MGKIVIMKICVFTNHFYPEEFKVNDIVFSLAEKGHKVTVITAIPDYPKKWMYRKNYSLFKRQKEELDTITIYRLPIIPRYCGNFFFIFLNYISYFISSYIFTFFHTFNNKYDLVFVHETSPFFIGMPAVHLKKRQRIPLVFWVLDLWPESLSAAGKIINKFLLLPFEKMVKYVYNNCDKILIGSKGFEDAICKKGSYKNKCIYYPNWAEMFFNESSIEISDIYPFNCLKSTDFIFLFAGNMGEAQNLPFILNAISRVKKDSIKFIFLGDGRKKEDLINFVNSYNLDDKVFFPGKFPISYMSGFMEKADVLLVSLKDEYIFNLTVPSKVQFYMAQGRPILASLNGEGSALITSAKCGLSVPVDDGAKLIEAIITLSEMPENDLKIMGKNAKKYYDDNFRKEIRIEQLENLFLHLHKERL